MFSRNTIRLEPTLYQRAEEAAKAAGYSGLNEFVAHAVEKELARLNSGEPAPDATEIEKQLRGLGYIE